MPFCGLGSARRNVKTVRRGGTAELSFMGEETKLQVPRLRCASLGMTHVDKDAGKVHKERAECRRLKPAQENDL